MLFNLFFRSLFIDTFLNEKNLQNCGFVYGMSPALKKICSSQKDYFQRLVPYFEYFNSNPFFTSAIIGLCINLEEKNKTDMISKIRLEAMAPIAALADSLIWGTLKPLFTVLFGTLALMAIRPAHFLFLFSFILVTNFFRIYNLHYARKLGLGFIFKLNRLHLQELISVLKRLGAVFFGGAVMILLGHLDLISIQAGKLMDLIFIGIYLLFNIFIFNRLKPVLSFLIFLGLFSGYYFLR